MSNEVIEANGEGAREELGPIPGGLAERARMTSVTVRTKAELQQAQKDLVPEIFVVGELADELEKASKIATLSKTAIAAITIAVGAGVALTPATLGTSGLVVGGAVAAAAATAGVGTATIVCAYAIGITLVLAVCKNYQKIDAKAGFIHLKLDK